MNNFDADDELFDELTVDEIEAAMDAQRMDLGYESGDIKERECDADVASFFPKLFSDNYRFVS
jgi:hypothetical protein